jgi:hypothetical protein
LVAVVSITACGVGVNGFHSACDTAAFVELPMD